MCALKVLFRFRWSGNERVPASGSVLVMSNHQSHLDPVLIGVASKRKLRFLARKTLFFRPFSWWISALGAFPIDQTSGLSGIRATLGLLRQEEGVAVFPEGSRTLDGLLGPMMPGFCALARRARPTLVPVGISGAYAALPRGSAIPRFSPIRLKFGEPIPPEEFADMNDEQLVELITARISQCIDEAASE